jgi:hypothetical protein
MKHTIRKVLTSRYLVISVTALSLYALAGFVIAPPIIRWYVLRYAQQNLHCRADVDKIRINPFLFTLDIRRFSLSRADKSPLVAFERLFIDLEMSSLFHRAVILRKLDLEKPDIRVIVEPDGSLNFEKLATTPLQIPEPAKPAAKPLPFILQSAVVREGQISVVDKRQNIPADLTLQGLNLLLKDVSTVKDRNGTYRLVAKTEDGASIQGEGEISLSPLRSKGKLTFNTVQIADLWKFFRDSTNLEQPAGRIDISTEYHLNADNTPVQLRLEGLRVSSSDLSLKLHNTDKAFLRSQKMDLNAPHFDLAAKKLHIGDLFLEEGAVDVRINDAGKINLQQMIREALPEKHHIKKTPPPTVQPSGSTPGADPKIASSPPAATTDPPFKVQADTIKVKNIAINLDDKSRKFPIKAAITGADLHLQANLEIGADENKIVLQEIASELRGIRIHGSSSPEPFFTSEKLTVEGGACDLDARSITFTRIAMNKGRLDAGLDAEGKINWQQLLQTKGDVEKVTEAEPAPDAAPAWKFLVKSFEVEGFSAKFSDLTTASDKPVLSLQSIKAGLTEVDGKSPMGFTVDFQEEQGGTATVSGTVHPAIPAVEADIAVSDIVLKSLQPYIEPYVTLKIQSASASAQGHLRYGMPKDAQNAVYEGNFSLNNLRLTDSTAQKPYLSWDTVQLPKFKLTLQPNGLDAQEIKISKPVGELIIDEDKTLNFVKVLKKRQGSDKTSSSPKPTPENELQKSGQEAFAYRISRVQVERGDMIFADLSLRPQFKTRIHDLKGMVTDLSSAQKSQAKVRMDGHVDQYGTAKIRGVMRPNDFGGSSDVDIIFRNVEMKSLSPYTGKFAGRLIKSGKLSADLKYTLQDYKMTGDNKIVIDNLLLGDQVDNPDSTNLPLDLAIALLKDSSGRIDIGLPVTGDLNDPHFSLGSLIWKMFANLITNTATAPFRTIGNLFGGKSENFDTLGFDPGSADLPPPEQEKLLRLADVLKSRPQLKLVIQGRYSLEADGMKFKKLGIRRIVAARLGTKLTSNDDPRPLDFTDSGTQDILEKLYGERFGKASLDELEKGIEAGTVKPQMPARHQEITGKEAGMLSKMADGMKLYTIIPGGKSYEQAALWARELYTRLVESEQVADTLFLQLAEKRAQSVAAGLEGEARIPKDRLSIKAPAPLSDNELPSVSLSLDSL